MAWLELVSIVPFSRLIILYVSLLSKCEVSLTDLNNSKGRFELCKYITQTHTHMVCICFQGQAWVTQSQQVDL